MSPGTEAAGSQRPAAGAARSGGSSGRGGQGRPLTAPRFGREEFFGEKGKGNKGKEFSSPGTAGRTVLPAGAATVAPRLEVRRKELDGAALARSTTDPLVGAVGLDAVSVKAHGKRKQGTANRPDSPGGGHGGTASRESESAGPAGPGARCRREFIARKRWRVRL